MTREEKELELYINQIIDATSQCVAERVDRDSGIFAKDPNCKRTHDDLRRLMLCGVVRNLQEKIK